MSITVLPICDHGERIRHNRTQSLVHDVCTAVGEKAKAMSATEKSSP